MKTIKQFDLARAGKLLMICAGRDPICAAP